MSLAAIFYRNLDYNISPKDRNYLVLFTAGLTIWFCAWKCTKIANNQPR